MLHLKELAGSGLLGAKDTSSSATMSNESSTQRVTAAALQLVKQLPDGCTYELCSPAVQQLQAMGNCPVAVVSISGPSRQGKSCALNRLVSAAGGFPVSPSLKPCTHGIWMWPQAIEVQGKPHKLLFMDSEGIATKEQSNRASTTIVALAGMVSSLLISNQVHNLHEDSLGNLSMAAAVMKRLFNSAGSATSGGQPICAPPELQFLLRDFGLDTEELTAPAYLEEQLNDLELGDALDESGICAKNGMRAMIRSVFPQRSALFLPHPGPSRAADVEAVPDSALNPGFVQGLSDLSSLVFARAAPKTFRGVTLTGPLLVSMLRGAVEAANKPGGVLSIGNMWSSMLEAELARTAESTRTVYDKAADELAACSSAEQAEQMHQDVLAAARAAFTSEIEFVDAASQAGAWAATERQLQLAFAALMERIRRQEAERQVAFGELLRAAKAAGLAALDAQGVVQRLEGCTDEEEAEKQVQASADAATKAGDSCLASWEGATPPQQTAALADMWIELAAAVSSARLAAVQQARAAAAAQQAKAAAAEQARLESERQLDGVQHAAVAAAVAKYKKAMSELAQNSTSEAEVRFKHGGVLADLLGDLPAKIPQQRLAAVQAQLQQRCTELLGTGLLIVQQRCAAGKSEDRAKLAEAERAAFAVFKTEVEGCVSRSCTDAVAAWRSCQACRRDALQLFTQAAAQQSSFPPSSSEHAAALKHLQASIDSWCNKLQDTVASNAQHAAEVARLAAKKEAELQQARAEAAAAAARLQAEEDARRAAQAAENARLAAQAQQQQQQQQDRFEAELRAAFAGLAMNRSCSPAAYMGGACGSGARLLQLPGSASKQYGSAGNHCYVVGEPDENMWGISSSSNYGRASSSRSAGASAGRRAGSVPLNRRGEPCRHCLKGFNCPSHRGY